MGQPSPFALLCPSASLSFPASMKSKSLLVILPAVVVFFLAIYFSLSTQTPFDNWGKARDCFSGIGRLPVLVGLSIAAQDNSLRQALLTGRLGHWSGCASQALPTFLPPQLHVGAPACSSTLGHTTPSPLGSLPFVLLWSQVSKVSIFIHLVPSFSYFTREFIFIKHPFRCKPCVVSQGSQGNQQ